MRIIVTPYTPSEAATASGRSVDNQRNDRRAGLAPKHNGHSRYDMRGVARNYVLQSFADMGIGPLRSHHFADEAARYIARSLKSSPRAWSARALNTLPPEKRGGGIAGVVELTDQLGSDLDEPTDSLFGCGIVVWANDEFEIANKFWELYGRAVPGDPKLRGPAVMMGFNAAAHAIAARLPRPMYDLIAE